MRQGLTRALTWNDSSLQLLFLASCQSLLLSMAKKRRPRLSSESANYHGLLGNTLGPAAVLPAYPPGALHYFALVFSNANQYHLTIKQDDKKSQKHHIDGIRQKAKTKVE